MIAFLADGQKKNMCIEYDDVKECKGRYDSLRNYRRTNNLQNVFDLWRKEKFIYILKTKKTGKKAEG